MKRRLLASCASVLVLAAFCSTQAAVVAAGEDELRAGQSAGTVSLACSETMPVFGQTVTFTATVTASGGNGVPTGTVTFKNGTAVLGTTMLMKGSGSYAIPSLAAGSHSITATYSGDGNFAGNASKALMLTVTALPAGADKNGAAFKIAENESPRPQNRQVASPPMPDTEQETTYFVGTANGGVWKSAEGIPFTVSSSKPTELGVSVQPVPGGSLSITSVANGSLAQHLGLQLNDRILSVDGQRLPTTSEPMAEEPVGRLRFEVVGASLKLFAPTKVSGPTLLLVDRGGNTLNIEVTLSANGTAAANALSNATTKGAPGAGPVDPNAWRYKHQNGEWWYYGPDEKWLVHRNGMWVKYTPTAGTTGKGFEKTFLDGNPSIGLRGKAGIPVVGDWDGDGRADAQTIKPGNTGPRAPATNGPIPGSPLRRAIGGNR